jgi:hypothetical protein
MSTASLIPDRCCALTPPPPMRLPPLDDDDDDDDADNDDDEEGRLARTLQMSTDLSSTTAYAMALRRICPPPSM